MATERDSAFSGFTLSGGAAARVILALFLATVATAQTGRAFGASCLEARRAFEIQSAGKIPFSQPSDLLFHENLLYVLDDLNGRIAVFEGDGSFRRQIDLPGGTGTSYLGFGLAGADQIFLSNASAGKIVVINLQGKKIREFATGEKGTPSEPAGIELAPAASFVVDNGSHQIKVFDLEGELLLSWGGLGDGPEQFRYPFRIALDSKGRVIVSDTLNSSVKIFTPKGDPLVSFGEFGVTEGTLFRPASLAVLRDDMILVGDNYLGSLQVFDSGGRYRSVLCGPDGQPLLMENPVSLAVDGSLIYALEAGRSRVSAYILTNW